MLVLLAGITLWILKRECWQDMLSAAALLYACFEVLEYVVLLYGAEPTRKDGMSKSMTVCSVLGTSGTCWCC